MKVLLRCICLLLCAACALVLPMTLVSCSGGQGEGGSDPNPAKDEIALFANGVCDYTIIREKEADELTRDAIIRFRNAFAEKFDARPSIKTDYVAEGQEIPQDQKEILIGNTNRPETAEARQSLMPDSFLIKVINHKLVIVADSTTMLISGILYFINNYIMPAEGSLVLDIAFTYVGCFEDFYPITQNGDGSYNLSINNFIVVFDEEGEYIYLRQLAETFEAMAKPYGGVLGVAEDETVNTFEILIGACDREDYVACQEEMMFRDFAIYVKNNTVSVNAVSIYGYDRAFDYIFSAAASGGLTIPAEGYYSAYDYGTGTYAELLKNYENPQLEGAWTLNICHRGDVTTNLPENSIPSYQACIDLGIDMIETDLQKTVDGVWVICHDTYIDRTTTGTGKISTMTLEKIKSYYLKTKNGGNSAQATEWKVPTLEEVINLCHGHVLFNLDKLTTVEDFRKVYDEFERLGAVDMAVFKSAGNADAAEQVAEWFCELMLADRELPMYAPMIYSGTQKGIARFKGLTSMIEAGTTLTKQVTDDAWACNIRIMCLTAGNSSLENVETYTQLIQVQGYGAIMTDDPVKLSQFIHG